MILSFERHFLSVCYLEAFCDFLIQKYFCDLLSSSSGRFKEAVEQEGSRICM